MRMNYKDLVNKVTRLLDEFQEDKHCIDNFTQDASKDLKVLFSIYVFVYCIYLYLSNFLHINLHMCKIMGIYFH